MRQDLVEHKITVLIELSGHAWCWKYDSTKLIFAELNSNATFFWVTKLLLNRFSSQGSISQVILHDPVLDKANSS